MKLKMKREYEKGIKSKSEREQNLPQVKFPKLAISKLEGTHLDWQRFWSQFEIFSRKLFGDASIIGTSAVAYAVIKQTSSKTQGFISSKSRLSKKNTSILRLE